MNKKGSILTVLVIVITIVLIGGYAVLKTYNAAVKQSLNSLGNTIIEIGDYYYYNQIMEKSIFKETSINLATTDLYKGDKIEEGTMIINDSGQIKFYIKNNGYCITKEYSSNSLKIIRNKECNLTK